MKKIYNKPEMKIDNYSLEQSIASGCEITDEGTTDGKMNAASKLVCGWDMGNMVIWSDAQQTCTTGTPIEMPFNGVCYNNPTGGKNLFSS